MTATRNRIVTALTALAVGSGIIALPVQAQAATDPNALNIAYDASGSSTVARTGSTVKLGPTVLTVAVNPDGSFTGSLPIPPAPTSFKAIGLLPTTATVSFIPSGPVTGSIGGTPVAVHSTSSYYLKLTNVTVGGIPTAVGNSCQTILPVKISAATPAGQQFDIINGGLLTGTYTIGLFVNCGLTTALIDLLIPGSNNTVTLTLSNGRLAGQ